MRQFFQACMYLRDSTKHYETLVQFLTGVLHV